MGLLKFSFRSIDVSVISLISHSNSESSASRLLPSLLSGVTKVIFSCSLSFSAVTLLMSIGSLNTILTSPYPSISSMKLCSFGGVLVSFFTSIPAVTFEGLTISPIWGFGFSFIGFYCTSIASLASETSSILIFRSNFLSPPLSTITLNCMLLACSSSLIPPKSMLSVNERPS